MPVVAIGGIGPHNAAALAQAGAAGVAAISQLCDAPDPESATRALRSAFFAQLSDQVSQRNPASPAAHRDDVGRQPPAASLQPSSSHE